MSDSFADQLPRHYQEEIFERSQRENIIAALDTGAGKTFISLLLLKWVASRQPGCKMIFLVPTVALVEQQGNFLAKSTLRITKFSGALNIDLSNRIGWSSKLEQGDLFVMTPQIFLDLLTHAVWRISQFALIIFDEAHHARKSHPYAKIMKEYFEVLSTSRPKIFGMTASPVWNTKDPAASLAALEATMDATVVAVHDNLDELARLAHRATEFIKQYPPPPADYESFPSPTLWKCLTVFEEVFQRHFGLPWDDIKRRYVATLQNLGPYSASMYLYLEIRHRLVDEDDISPEIAAIQDMLMSHDSFFKLKLIPLQWCSPKIEALVQILSAHLDNSAKKFRGIIFVQQRQVAVCLARLLPCIPGLSETIRCAELVGGGQGTDGRGFDLRSVGMVRTAQDTVKAFRQGEINLLVATSVAEEGLDFPECEFVVRFDPLQNMVGYVQSRGRARSKASVFVIMVEEEDAAQMARYQVFLNQEPQLKALYSQSAQDIDVEMHEIEEPEENDQPTDLDLAQRERYVVPSTGAFLTCDNAIHLLGRLCASIPRQDSSYVSANAYAPKYSGDFEAILQLPSVLPLPRAELRFTGPRRSSKREAKRAVAWVAVKRLRELEVLDEYLLPAAVERSFEDSKIDVSHIPSEMEVLVCDPWAAADWNELWIHSIFIDDRRVAGLVTGANLPPVEFREGETLLRTSGGTVLSHSEHRLQRLRAMEEFTKQGIWYRITGTPLDLPLKLYIVPILESTGQPDFCAIERLLASPRGNLNWDDINEENYGHLMVRNVNLIGQFYVLQQIRDDLSPSSAPPPHSIEAEVGFSTYREYWIDKWTGKPGQKRQPQVPESGPLLALTRLPRLNRMTKHHDTVLFPRDCCGWISISEDVCEALRVLPVLCHRVTSAYRARRARLALSLPPILEGVLVEALTLPCASAGYDNQRLETLGDAVLQLCTTVYLYNRYPNRHEGQLSIMRQNRVCNRFLLSRAKEVGLESFLTCEDLSVKTWASGIQRQGADDDDDPVSVRRVRRQFPRRSLQDCMEAVLGASFVTGGIQMALHAGRGLGLDFGGPTPWGVRYAARDESPVPSTFAGLEDALGYSFRCGALLGEALTHSSVDNQMTRSYERLEFLGDAILDLVVVAYLFRKFPESNSDGLAWPRTRVICAPTLAAVGVRRLGLHRLVLINSVELGMAVERYVPELEACSAEEIVLRSWAYDPPKVLSDVFESVIGAVLVDSNYDYERTASVVEFVMQDVLEVVHPSLPRDPVSELLQWAAKAGRKIVFDKPIGSSAVTVLEHGEVVAGPVASTSSAVAKNLVAEAALSVLRDRT